ncbi:MAG: sugar ABC transporter permease [Actinobacteria bacterium]|nr:sugar ABC transporter permease [Actinomycetota bacterium]
MPQGRARLTHLRSRPGEGWRSQVAGWLFCLPAIVLLVMFLVIPIALAAWVSLSNWQGIGSPLASGVHSDGLANYKAQLVRPGLAQQFLGESLRNNLYFVLLVVPIQTFLALVFAIIISRKGLFARGFFRTAYYFPSVASSVAIAILFQFLFSGSGTVNTVLGFIGVHGPSWFTDPSGIIQDLLGVLGVRNGPGVLVHHGLLGNSWWQWLAGPSVAMCVLIFLAIWTTTGTLMIIFLPALYNISAEVEEAAKVDGASAWTQFWKITVPLIRPVMFLVITLGIIGTWQVFDSVALISQGMPQGTTLTPAYLAYTTSFSDQQFGQGAAISFLLFALIIVIVLLQRWWLRSRETRVERRERREQRAVVVQPARLVEGQAAGVRSESAR